jgi:hypothetical protein
MKNSTILCISLLLVTACSGKSHPKMLSFTPASVVIDYSDNDLHEATGMAQQFCSSINKDAQYVRTEKSGWVTEERHAFFNCVENNRSGSGNNNHGTSNSTIPIINNFK